MSEGYGVHMSVVVVTPDGFDNIRKTIEHLRAQTVLDQLEVVIVAPSAANFDCRVGELRNFRKVQVIEVGEIKSTGRAIAAGVRAARAPVVAYAEEHSYPSPGWAEALVNAHQQPWAAVGAALTNANPDNMISWASLFTDFGPWVEPSQAGEIGRLPWHHTAYKRALLLDYGSNLGDMLETESRLHADLQAKGYRFYLEPAAKTNHVNISRLSSYIRAEFHGARMFAASRAGSAKRSSLSRLLYISVIPFVPFVRLKRVLGHIFRSGRAPDLLPGIVFPLVAGLIADACGQIMGYAFDAGHSAQRRVSFELMRYQHVIAKKPASRN
jgi:hypothetical protein